MKIPLCTHRCELQQQPEVVPGDNLSIPLCTHECELQKQPWKVRAVQRTFPRVSCGSSPKENQYSHIFNTLFGYIFGFVVFSTTVRHTLYRHGRGGVDLSARDA